MMMKALNKNGYYFDLNTMTLHMTNAYERKTLVYASPECYEVLKYQRRFPEMTIEVHKRKPSSNKPLPYKMMKAYIAIMPNAAAMLEEFERVQKASVAFKSPYKYVEKWFKGQFPNYEKFVKYDENGNLVWKVTDLMTEANREAETAKQQEEQTSEGNEEERCEADAAPQTRNEDVEVEAVTASQKMVA